MATDELFYIPLEESTFLMYRDKDKANLGYNPNIKATKKKHISQHMAYQLYYQNEDSSIRSSYQNTIYCRNSLVPNEEGKLISNYCKNRWCPTCQSIRIAKLIDGYKNSLNTFKDPQFVTLTLPTIPLEELDNRIDEMRSAWQKILASTHFRKHRPQGLRKTECTLRPNDLYHYHYHIIIDGEEHGRKIIQEWLKRFPQAKAEAQDIRRIENENGYLEIFKYFTKLIAQDKTTGKRYIDFKRLNNIFEKMKGTRVFQPFGGLRAVEVDEEIHEDDLEGQYVEEDLRKIWTWATGVGYVSEDGEILTGDYELPSWVEELCGKMDKELPPPPDCRPKDIDNFEYTPTENVYTEPKEKVYISNDLFSDDVYTFNDIKGTYSIREEKTDHIRILERMGLRKQRGKPKPPNTA